MNNTSVNEFVSFGCVVAAERLLDALDTSDELQVPQLVDDLRRMLALVKLPPEKQVEEYRLLLDLLKRESKKTTKLPTKDWTDQQFIEHAQQLAASNDIAVAPRTGVWYIKIKGARGSWTTCRTPKLFYENTKRLVAHLRKGKESK